VSFPHISNKRCIYLFIDHCIYCQIPKDVDTTMPFEWELVSLLAFMVWPTLHSLLLYMTDTTEHCRNTATFRYLFCFSLFFLYIACYEHCLVCIYCYGSRAYTHLSYIELKLSKTRQVHFAKISERLTAFIPFIFQYFISRQRK